MSRFSLDEAYASLPDSEHGLFVLRGDLSVLRADVYLVPSDAYGTVEPAWDSLVGQHRDEIARRCDELVSSDCMLLTGEAIERNVLVVNIGGATSSNNPTEMATRLMRSLQFLQEHLDAHPERFSLRRQGRPLLALPVVGVGRGGLGPRTGEVLAALDELLSDRGRWLTGEAAFDVAIVCRSASDYAALQHVRRRKFSNIPDWVRRLADFARQGRLSIMFGAGASIPLGLPSWAGLLDSVGSDLGMSASERDALAELDPVDAATILADRAGSSEKFHEAVVPYVTSEEVSLTHGLLATIGPPMAITTNYDTCYEIAIAAAGRSAPVVLPWETIPGPETAAVLKLHGDVSRGQIVLARDDFASVQVRRRPLIGVVQERLLVGHVLTVGSTVSDPTLVQAAEEVGALLSQVRSDDKQTFGTVVLTQRSTGRELLLERNFDLVLPDESEEATIEEVARTVDVLLDLVACLASDSLAFALDPKYEGLLPESEAVMSAELQQVARVIAKRMEQGADDELTTRAADFLNSLGAPRD